MRFLFVDRIVKSVPGKLIQGIKHITQDDAYLTVDAQNKVCFISSLIGETLGQLAAWNVMQYHQFALRPVAGVVGATQLSRPAYLGETLYLESIIDSVDDQVVQYQSTAYVDNEAIFSIQGALGPLLPMDDFIDSEIIQQQFNEINHPGEWYSSKALPKAEPVIAKKCSLHPPMVFDHILDSVPGVSLVAQKCISRAASYFADHFPKKPVLPLTVLLECKINLAYEFIARAGYESNYKVQELRKIKMNEFVPPGAVLICYVKVKLQNEKELILSYRSEVDGKRVCVVDIVLNAQG